MPDTTNIQTQAPNTATPNTAADANVTPQAPIEGATDSSTVEVLDESGTPQEGTPVEGSDSSTEGSAPVEEVFETWTPEAVTKMKSKSFAGEGASDYTNRSSLSGSTITGYFFIMKNLTPALYTRADGSEGKSFAFIHQIKPGVYKTTHITGSEYDLISSRTKFVETMIEKKPYSSKEGVLGCVEATISFANTERGEVKLPA